MKSILALALACLVGCAPAWAEPLSVANDPNLWLAPTGTSLFVNRPSLTILNLSPDGKLEFYDNQGKSAGVVTLTPQQRQILLDAFAVAAGQAPKEQRP